MNEPNFFIMGAPKCGTTSLAYWLDQHPEVFMSPMKEPHYFSTDFPLVDWRDWGHYRSLFENAKPQHKAVGEASVWYLRSRDAAQRIETYLSGARYIVMLRNPVEMAPSLHWQVLYSGDETVKNFAQAWSLQQARESGRKIPKTSRVPELVKYRSACKLGEQLNRLYEIVDRERVLTIFMDDLQENSHREWKRILTFLDVCYWDDHEFRSENRSKHWTWPWVRDLQNFYGRIRGRFGLPPLGWGVFENLRRISVKEAEREPLSEEMHRELVDTFSSDIDLLADLTGRDLSHWKKT